MASMEMSNPPALSPDLVAAVERLAEAANKFAAALAEAANKFAAALAEIFNPIIEKAVKVWQEISQLLSAYWREHVAPVLVDLGRYFDMERAYRNYAAWYNARHPARRIAWRRLSGPHKLAAAQMYLELPSS